MSFFLVHPILQVHSMLTYYVISVLQSDVDLCKQRLHIIVCHMFMEIFII